jgi:hypothetical protein
MATQGLVTVLKDGKVRMKIVAGTNGSKAAVVARAIKDLRRVPTLKEAYQLAAEHNFGTRQDLIVINQKRAKYEGSEPLPPRYRSTFNSPVFNPRWKYGIADHVEVVRL